MGIKPGLLLNFLPQSLQVALRVLHIVMPEHQRLGQIPGIVPAEGLLHTVRHAVVEVDNGLSAVLVVLVGLNGNAGKGGVAGNVVGRKFVGLPQIAVPGGKPAFEQLLDVDLAAGSGEGIEIQIVNMDIPLLVGLGMLGLENEHLIELLGALAAVFQHGTHGGIAIDIGVLPLYIGVHRIGKRDILVGLHKPGVHFPDPAALIAVENVGLGRLDISLVHQYPLHQVLNMLYLRGRRALHLQDGQHLVRQGGGHVLLPRLVGSFEGLGDCARNLFLIKTDQPPVPLPQFFDRHFPVLLSISLKFKTVPGGRILTAPRHKILRAVRAANIHIVQPQSCPVK